MLSFPFRTIGASFALLTTSFNQASAPAEIASDFQTETIEAIPASLIIPQEEAVAEAVRDFRQSYARQVRENNNTSLWKDCFSTKARLYKEDDVAKLRAIYRIRTGFVKIGLMADDLSTYTRPIVVLDLGHGHETKASRAGYDTGAVDKTTRLKETQVIDRVAAPLKEKLESEYGLIVVPTRTPVSEGLTLTQADSKFSNQKAALQIRADLSTFLSQKFPDAPVIFVSIHANIGAQSGAEIYYYGPSRGAPTDSPESRRLAASIASSYRLRPGTRTSAITNDFAVLRGQPNPAVLVELGYINQPADRSALADAEGISRQIAKGIGLYANGGPAVKPLPSLRMALLD